MEGTGKGAGAHCHGAQQGQSSRKTGTGIHSMEGTGKGQEHIARPEQQKTTTGMQDREGFKGSRSRGKWDALSAAWHKGSEPCRVSKARVGEQHGRKEGREGGFAAPLPTAIKVLQQCSQHL